MTNDEIDLLILKHGAMDQWPTQNQCHEFASAIRNAALEEVAGMVSLYLSDHGIDQARECLPDAIRAMKTKDQS